MLSKEQIEYFECFGFLHLRQAFSNAEVKEITDAAEEVFEAELGRLTGEEYGDVDYIVEGHPRQKRRATVHRPQVRGATGRGRANSVAAGVLPLRVSTTRGIHEQ